MTDLSPASVTLRGRRPRDLPTLRRWLTDPDAAWRAWDAPYLPAQETTASLQRYAEQLASSPPHPNERVIDVAGVVVGMVNRAEEDPAGSGWWDLGILIYDPAHWGRGLGARALSLWVQATLDETDAHVLTFSTWSGNERMLRAAARLGFREAARIREARAVGDRRFDAVRLDLLRREWPGGA
ncbi:GNAT family N-acetyltransferase [Deinococcus taeanensis]|uniref:GNAT family N-acetyltransferase n=1 Tax=Deinococcus taeanensis TaxID=2737050 RepID=UPI001CDC9E8A|nr:GNAT family protein [Deinococcus taeanensis]UBV43620.1 GNAT family N-acetyltransferase [Deinococcus taeanensis]